MKSKEVINLILRKLQENECKHILEEYKERIQLIIHSDEDIRRYDILIDILNKHFLEFPKMMNKIESNLDGIKQYKWDDEEYIYLVDENKIDTKKLDDFKGYIEKLKKLRGQFDDN